MNDIMVEIWYQKYADGTEGYVTLEDWGGEWFVDMDCCTCNRFYKSKKWAVKYLEKCGFTKVEEIRNGRYRRVVK